MKRLRSLIVIALAVAAAGAGLYISAANREIVTIDLLFWNSVSLRAGLLIVMAFVAGAVTGLLVGGMSTFLRNLGRTGAGELPREAGRR